MTSTALADIIYVDPRPTGGNKDGSEWQHAFLTLQDALDDEDTGAGDTIRVAGDDAGGIFYYPDDGDNDAVTEPLDLDGNPRILNDVVDMGPYESVCNDVQSVKARCRGEKPGEGRLVAKLRTSLPDGSAVMLRCNGDDLVAAPINNRGRGKAKWKHQTGEVEVCPSGCPDLCNAALCP